MAPRGLTLAQVALQTVDGERGRRHAVTLGDAGQRSVGGAHDYGLPVRAELAGAGL
jgi:hypothetical protein